MESQLGRDISSGHVLFYQVDKEGEISVLHRASLVRQLKKVGRGEGRGAQNVGGVACIH